MMTGAATYSSPLTTAKTPRPDPMVIWNCGDHGSAVRSVLTISADRGAVRAVDRDYGCRGERNAGRLVRTQVW